MWVIIPGFLYVRLTLPGTMGWKFGQMVKMPFIQDFPGKAISMGYHK
jgi:hypothetical protein